MADHAATHGESFLTRVIKEFFLVLLAVGVLEIAISLGFVVADFYTRQPAETKRIAERVASHVKSVMVNKGGPVAAKTMFPILKDTYDTIGYDIAIEPTPVTVSSIRKTFDFQPRGIPAGFRDGVHHEAKVEIRAEQFCLSCHIDAKEGDTLGVVSARSYLLGHIVGWWQDAQRTAVASMGKIVLHTVVLYILLRARMAPLIGVSTAVSQLAKAGATLRTRAQVRSHDEFGQLANDINLFLDRVTYISEDLGDVLRRLAALNTRLNQVRQQLGTQTLGLRQRVDGASRALLTARADSGRIETLLSVLTALRDSGALSDELSRRLADTEQALRGTSTKAPTGAGVAPGPPSGTGADAGAGAPDDLGERVVALHDDVANIGHLVAEMGVLEERMEAIAKEGDRLLHRLLGPDAPPAESEG